MDATTSAFIEATGQTAGDFFTSIFPLVYWFIFIVLTIFIFQFIWITFKEGSKNASKIIRGKRF